VWGFCVCKPRKPRKPISLPSRPRKKAQNPTFPCKKGLSGRGRGVTNKKQNFTPKTQNPKNKNPKKEAPAILFQKRLKTGSISIESEKTTMLMTLGTYR
jgi:hypothetical protein